MIPGTSAAPLNKTFNVLKSGARQCNSILDEVPISPFPSTRFSPSAVQSRLS